MKSNNIHLEDIARINFGPRFGLIAVDSLFASLGSNINPCNDSICPYSML